MSDERLHLRVLADICYDCGVELEDDVSAPLAAALTAWCERYEIAFDAERTPPREELLAIRDEGLDLARRVAAERSDALVTFSDDAYLEGADRTRFYEYEVRPGGALGRAWSFDHGLHGPVLDGGAAEDEG